MKLPRLWEIMTRYTDAEHGITINEIIGHLEAFGITADRKSIYDDMEALRELGLDIIMEKEGRSYLYKVVGREFELPELKLLVDVIMASKFITTKKSRELIKKLGRLCSDREASKLRREVEVTGRVKTMNESIYYIVDQIHSAISEDRQISFLYYRWNAKKELEVRRGGERYRLSPFALLWDNENYYLVGYDERARAIKNYRVDRMGKLRMEDSHRVGRSDFAALDMTLYTSHSFGMFGGEETKVRLRVKNELAGVIIDRFGRDVIMIPDGDEHFAVNVSVCVSDQFLGWVFGLGGKVRITGPEKVVSKMRERLEGELSAL